MLLTWSFFRMLSGCFSAATVKCFMCRFYYIFFLYLCVYEEEGDLLVLHAGLQHDAFDVFPPFCQPIILSQLDLETLIVRPDRQAKKQGMYCSFLIV